ncbi:MAG: hypothetical protein N4A40_12670 [Tissierellales bacterium]|jgi:hypothetical protein|nr:hypothetical protein [Tissierellales bacterium]
MDNYFNISIDGGNSTIKSKMPDGTIMAFDNIVASASKVNYTQDENLSGSGLSKLDITVIRNFDKLDNRNSDDYSEIGNRFLLGKMTAQNGASRRPRTDKMKGNDPQLVDSMLGSIAYSMLYSLNKQKKNIADIKTLGINLGTGLPFHEWMIPEQREKFKEYFLGNHIVKFNHPWFENNRFPTELEIRIGLTKVFVEGESSANYILNNVENEFQNKSPEELLDTSIFFIDMGAFTTEVIGKMFLEVINEEEFGYDDEPLVVEHRTLPNLSDGIKKGIGHVMNDTITALKNKNPKIDKLTRKDIEEALKPKGRRGGKDGYIPGTDINVLEDFRRSAKAYAKEIAESLQDIINTNEIKGKIRKIYLLGGGSMIRVVVDEVKRVLAEDDINPQIVIAISKPNPVALNVVGYYNELEDYLELAEEEGVIVNG